MEAYMATQISVWQIESGDHLVKLEKKLKDGERDEPNDLEGWLEKKPEIIGENIRIIGRQVSTKTGPMDLLGIDEYGNAIIIELKRDKLAREALAQALDYASDVASWSFERLDQECQKYNKKPLDEYFSEAFSENNSEDLSFNISQRIILIGFSVDEPLQRMIEWLHSQYSVNINAIALKYILTKSKDELIARTAIIPEDQESIIVGSKRIVMKSDAPGKYDDDDLKERLQKYLSLDRFTSKAIREILIPMCLANSIVTREMIKDQLIKQDKLQAKNNGVLMSNISQQLGHKHNDFLRQIISYEYPNRGWEKDNYSIIDNYRKMVNEIIMDLK
jgi:hypothetical protein